MFPGKAGKAGTVISDHARQEIASVSVFGADHKDGAS
jgi:hypothetical protein